MIEWETFVIAVGVLAGLSGAAWAIYQLAQRINAGLRRQDKIDQMLEREFSDDGNGSLKSQVLRTSGQVDVVNSKLDLAQRELQFLQYTVDTHVADLTVHAHDPEAHRRDDNGRDDGPAGPR